MEIFSLRIKRTRAGIHFPFDRIYLTTHENRVHLKALFRYALVMPVEGFLKGLLLDAPPDQYINRTFDRDDDELHPSPLEKDAWQSLIEKAQWVMAVPLLTRWAKKNTPKYLVAKGWYSPQVAKMRQRTSAGPGKNNPSPFPSLTYLQTPDKNVRPVCVLCPRFILHQNGECQIGEKICFESLPLGIHNYFKEGLDSPLPTPNVKEPEIQTIIDEHVPENDPRKDRVQDPEVISF